MLLKIFKLKKNFFGQQQCPCLVTGQSIIKLFKFTRNRLQPEVGVVQLHTGNRVNLNNPTSQPIGKVGKIELLSINIVLLLFSVIFLIASITFNIATNNIESTNSETLEITSLGYLNSILAIKIIFIFQFIKHIYYSIQSLFFDYVNTNISEYVSVMITFKKKR